MKIDGKGVLVLCQNQREVIICRSIDGVEFEESFLCVFVLFAAAATYGRCSRRLGGVAEDSNKNCCDGKYLTGIGMQLDVNCPEME